MPASHLKAPAGIVSVPCRSGLALESGGLDPAFAQSYDLPGVDATENF